MKFGYTIIFVPDLEKTLTFYEKAFGLKRKFVADSGLYGELDTGATTLSFCMEEHIQREKLPFQPARLSESPHATLIAFCTDDVDRAFEKAVDAGATPIAPPNKKPWGQTTAHMRDINGFLVELCTPMA